MKLKFNSSITQISAPQWDALFEDHSGYPFAKHAFLAALETTQCTTKESGWAPHHLAAFDDSNNLIAVLILFLKTHSYGEYVFDWAWADAYEHHGLNYYPKLISAIPFTPATGPRFGFAKNLSTDERAHLLSNMMEHIQKFVYENHYSGAHILFPTGKELRELTHLNTPSSFCEDKPLNYPKTTDQEGREANNNRFFWQMRTGCQYHWFNQNYTTFDDFLSVFSSRKRKNVKKERAKVQAQNINLTFRKAEEIPEDEWCQFYALYHHTYLKRSGRYGYLTQEFFQKMSQAFPSQVLLCQAWKEKEMVAAALYFRDDHTLYGRYWGAMEEYNGLHFEACYYQGIEYAIQHKLRRFDPGAQGEHKIQRGFTPIKTSSSHWLAHPGFQQGVADFLQRETTHMESYIDQARTLLPFREEVKVMDRHILL